MKQFICAIIFAIFICLISESFLYFPRTYLYPIFDSPLMHHLPRTWRTTRCVLPKQMLKINMEGLDKMTASGSGQFSEANLWSLAQQVSATQLIILDLRQESHGLINGRAVSWTDGKFNYANLGKSLSEVEADEQKQLQLAVKAGNILIDPYQDPHKVTVKEVTTERELVESLGFTYIRLPITDHQKPSDQVLDQFISLVKELPKDSWIHFHCKAGKGRTTTFMALYDMMLNAKRVSFDDIINRQALLGGANLFDINKPEFYKQKPAAERLELVKNFYIYCQQVPDFHMSWSDWITQRSALVKN